jgi:hypothetical protein
MSAMNSLIGAAAGAGIMYVLDPVSGTRRRALARDKIGYARCQVTDAIGTILRDAQNRVRGLVAALVSELRPGKVPDHVLGDRIRSRLGTLVRYPRLVHVRCENGNVFLSGVVASDEVARAVHRIRRMQGVDRVENRLELRADPAELPGAQSPVPQPASGSAAGPDAPALVAERSHGRRRVRRWAPAGWLAAGRIGRRSTGARRDPDAVPGADQRAPRRRLRAPARPRYPQRPASRPAKRERASRAVVVGPWTELSR